MHSTTGLCAELAGDHFGLSLTQIHFDKDFAKTDLYICLFSVTLTFNIDR